MAGYWPSSFFACLWKSRSINTHAQFRGQYPAILTEQAWSIKDLLYGIKHHKMVNVPCETQPVSRAGKIVPSCPLGQPITARDLVHLARSRSQSYNKCGLLTKLVRSIWLDIGQVLFLHVYVSTNMQKRNKANIQPPWLKKLGQLRIYFMG